MELAALLLDITILEELFTELDELGITLDEELGATLDEELSTALDEELIADDVILEAMEELAARLKLDDDVSVLPVHPVIKKTAVSSNAVLGLEFAGHMYLATENNVSIFMFLG